MLPFLIAAAAVSGVAALTDAVTGRIPNWLTWGALAGALLWHFAYGWHFAQVAQAGLFELAKAFGGMLLCAAAPVFLYWKRAIGGGDVKLFAAIGALCLPLAGLEMMTYAFIAATIMAGAKLAYQGVLLQTFGRSFTLVANPFRKAENRKELPAEMMTWFRMGPAIFAGALVTVVLHLGDVS
jgi:prepilin peptidase CpaA